MARVLLTGMSGTGKSTVLAALAGRGVRTVDTDFDGWVLADGTWDEPRMRALLATDDDLVVSGTVDNQGRFYDRFDHVVLLSAPVNVLLERVARRADNPYGRSRAQQEEIRRYQAEVEPLLARRATLRLDATQPVASVVAAVAALLGNPSG